MKTRGQKALINTVVLGFYQLTYFVCGIILPRFMLTSFGSDYNGVISSISQLLNFISILQLGIAGATRFSLYKVLAENNIKGISGIVKATEKYLRKVGTVLLAYILILVFAYPKFANTSVPAFDVGLLVLIIGASSFSQYFFGMTYQILLTADQRQYIYYSLATVATILNTLIAVILINSDQNIFVVKLGSAIIFVLVPIILSLYVKKKYSIDKKVEPDNAGVKGRKAVMWHSIANVIHDNTDLTILTLLANTKFVSVYTVHYLVVNGLFKFMSIFTNSLEAGFGNMFAKGEIKTAYRNFEWYEYFMGAFVSVVFSCALVLINPFVKLYTAGVNDVNYNQPIFAVIVVIAQMIMCMRQPYLTVVQAAGHYKQTKNGAFLEAGLNVIISFVATLLWGVVGVAIGTLVANWVRTTQYMIYIRNNIIYRSLKKSILIFIWVTFNVSVIYIVSMQVVRLFVVDTWQNWVLIGFVCLIIAFVVVTFSSIVFYKKQLYFTTKIIKRFLKKTR